MFKPNTTLRNAVRVILVLAVLIVAAGIIIDRDTHEFTLQTAVGTNERHTSNIRRFFALGTRKSRIIDLVARTRPAVVQITTTTQRNRIRTSERRQMTPEQEEQFRDFLGEEFFRRFLENRNKNHASKKYRDNVYSRIRTQLGVSALG